VGLKYCPGFSRVLPSAITIGLMAGSFYFPSLSLKDLFLGTFYSIWTGIEAIGTVILGIVLFEQSLDIIRLICLFLIVTGKFELKIAMGRC
jgi:quaternary ammonium compound-resistance protein SugE